MQWQVPRAWEGETAFVLGGGRSLDLVDVGRLREAGRVIAVNDAGLVRAPWADVLYFADAKWLNWNRDELHRFTGSRLVTRMTETPAAGREVLQVHRDKVNGLSRDPGAVAGWCSGSNAINLAFLFGARRIVLLGFDMRPGRWHDRHKRRSKPTIYADRFIPALERMARELRTEGIDVVNATPGSALACFPIAHPDGLLR